VSTAILGPLRIHNGMLYACRTDGLINSFNLTTMLLFRTFEGHKGPCNFLLVDENYLFSCGQDFLAKKWDLNSGQLLLAYTGEFLQQTYFVGHKANVFQVATLGNFLFTSGWDSTAKQWDKNTGKVLQTYTLSQTGFVISLAITTDGLYLFTGTTAQQFLLCQWRITDGGLHRVLNGCSCFI
jgi:WD40 repeat protein